MTITKDLFSIDPDEEMGFAGISISHRDKSKVILSSVQCKKEDWDTRYARIRPTDMDYKLKNGLIDSLFRRVAGELQNKIDDCFYKNFDLFTAGVGMDKLISHDNSILDTDKSSNDPAFIDVINKKIEISRSLNTRRGYENLKRFWERNFDDIRTIDMDTDFFDLLIERIEYECGNHLTMQRQLQSKINSVINFGRKRGIIKHKIEYDFPKMRIKSKDRNLNIIELYHIFEVYRSLIDKDPKLVSRATLSVSLFILDISFQGLAPVDLANLRVSDIKYETIYDTYTLPKDIYNKGVKMNNERLSGNNKLEIVNVKTYRQKTGTSINIATFREPISKILKALCLDKNPNDYLIPCFDRQKVYTEKSRQNRLSNFFNKMAKYMNATLDNYYKENSLGEHRRISYYFARHAFCNCVDSMDVPRNVIQRMVGHRTTVLETSYLRPADLWEQADISRKLFEMFE